MARSRNHFVLPTNLKLPFNYYAASGATAKIDFARGVVIRGKTDGERLLRLQRREKLYRSDAGNLTLFAPLKQRSGHFVEDNHSRNDRRAGKMSGQARVVGGNGAPRFKIHVA